MKIFDAFYREDEKYKKNNESTFAFLNRSSIGKFCAVRENLEAWFSHYPEKEQLELRARFRSKKNSSFSSAFFELFLYEILLKMDCKIIIHPDIPDTTTQPDFLVTPSNGESFYLEAVLVTNKSDKKEAEEARENTIYDALNRKVKSKNFYIGIEILNSTTSSPDTNKLAKEINYFLNNLDPDKIIEYWEKNQFLDYSSLVIECNGWKFEIEALPKGEKFRDKQISAPIGAISYRGGLVDHVSPIKRAILKKAEKYGKLNLPYLIAVDILEYINDIDIDIHQALFGHEQFTFCSFANEPKFSRQQDGVWSHLGYKHAGISGLLLITQLLPWNIKESNFILYHNPWARIPYQSVFTRFPQGIVKDNKIKNLEGISIADILK